MNQVVQTPDQYYYLIKLLDYYYIISYKHGQTNKVADVYQEKTMLPVFIIFYYLILLFISYQFYYKKITLFQICRTKNYNRATNNIQLTESKLAFYYTNRPFLSKFSPLKIPFCKSFMKPLLWSCWYQ